MAIQWTMLFKSTDSIEPLEEVSINAIILDRDRLSNPIESAAIVEKLLQLAATTQPPQPDHPLQESDVISPCSCVACGIWTPTKESR
jgi:hypothetical protein